MLQNLQKFAKFQKIQLDNLVDFEKCCNTRICLQRSVQIQPKTSEILPKFAKNWQLPYRSTAAVVPAALIALQAREDHRAEAAALDGDRRNPPMLGLG